MTEKQVKRLKKAELLEILFYMRKEIDSLQEENEQLKEKLDKYSSGGNVILSDANLETLSKTIEESVSRYLGQSKKGNKKR